MKPVGIHYIAEFIQCSNKAINKADKIETILDEGIAKSGLHVVSIHGKQFDPDGATVVAIVTESHIAIHTYPEARHASIDIFTCSPTPEPPFALLEFLRKKLKPKTTRIALVHRGNPIEVRHTDWMTGFSTTGLEIKYHIKKHLISKRSHYQQIDIIEHANFGRMLFLDHDLQIAENDIKIYDEHLVSPLLLAGSTLKNVVILGGGDGGVLHELLQYEPKKVTLVEIDEQVIKLSKKYLPTICKRSFANKKVKVVIDDAYHYLSQHHAKFDAVIYDLSWHPEAFMNIDREKFMNTVFRNIKKGLIPGGMVTIQCCPEIDKETLRIVRKVLKKHFKNILYTTTFIPSCCANWVFASATT